jgi:cytochrome c biogenesis protein
MTQDVRSHPVAGPTTPGAEVATVNGVDVALEKLWHFLTSMKVAIVLLLLFAVIGLVGTLVIQAPAGVLGDAAAKADWLDSIRPRYGGLTGIMDQLQLFTIFSSIWMRAIVIALTISLIACSVQRLPGLWKTVKHPHVDVGPAFFEHAPQHEAVPVVGRSADEALKTVTAVFKKHRYRVVSTDDGVVHVYADKNRWTGFLSVMAHLALVVILIGVMVGSMFGFRDGEFILAEGSSLPVPTMAGMTIALESFEDAYYAETGAPADYASDVVVYQDGQEVQRQTIRVNEPLRIGDLSFFQSFYGPAAAIKVTGEGDKTLVEEGVPLAWSMDNGARVGSVTIPEAGLVAWIVGTTGSTDPEVKPGQVRVEVYKADEAGTFVEGKTIDQNVATTVGGLTFTFQREIQFTGLSVAKDPGVMIVWLGSLLLMVGFVARFTLPHRRIWARIATEDKGRTTLALASPGARDVTQGTEFADLVVDVRAALAAPRQA